MAGYTGPFVAQQVGYDGLHQQIEAGSIPVTSQTDIDNLVKSLVARTAANSILVTAASLNLTQQVLSGTFQSGAGTSTASGVPATLWSLDSSMFQARDPGGVARFQAGNLPANGVSPAQWGFRANAADGTPLFDSIGAVGLPKKLAEVIQTSAVQGTNTSFADVSGGVTPSFTLSRQANLLVMAMGRVACQPVNSGFFTFLGLRCGSYCLFFWTTLAAGSYTAALQANAQGGVGAQWNVAYVDCVVFQFGS